MSDTMVAPHMKADHNSRKNKKPLMEKKRRARINRCLSELKSLVLQAIKKDSSQFSKLEKADILELTVKHLRALQRQQVAGMSQDPGVASKYRAGFNECAKEVLRYMNSVREVNDDARERVMTHLASCLQVVNQIPVDPMSQPPQMKPLHVHIPPPHHHPAPSSQQALNAGITSVAPSSSVILPSSHQNSLNLGFGSSAVSLVSSSSTLSSGRCASSSPELQTPSPVMLPNPLSALQLQSVATATTAPTTVLSHNPAHISGAFKLVPSSSCPGGAVALYLGGPGMHRSDAVGVDAVPLYSVSVPQSDNGATTFVPPPPSSASHMPGASQSPMMRESVISSSSSPPVKMECSSRSPPLAPLPLSLPVDLRQTHKVKVPMDTSPYSYAQYSPASMTDEKLWRPW